MRELLGLLWIPALLGSLLWRERLLLGIFSVAAIFQSQSVIEFGDDYVIPITPSGLIQLAIAGMAVLKLIGGQPLPAGRDSSADRAFKFLAFFVIYSSVSAVVLPFIFRGMPVYSPRGGIDQQNGDLAELEFNASSFAQIIYLIFNFLIVIFGGWLVRRSADFTSLCRWFFWCGVVMSLFCIWQKISQITGVFFPYYELHSNTVYHPIEGVQYIAADHSRVSGSFPEPSFAGLHLVTHLVFTTWLLIMRVDLVSRRSAILALVLGLFSVVISGATTGYIGIVIWAGTIVWAFPPMKAGRFVPSRMLAYVSVVTVGAIAVAVAATVFFDQLQSLLAAAIFEKGETSSAINRVAADVRAFEIVLETYGLGVGLGSNRPASFGAFMASDVGLIGVIAFAGVIYHVMRSARLDKSPYGPIRRALSSALFVMVLTKAASVPDLNTPWMWFLFALAWKPVGEADTSPSTRPDAVRPDSPSAEQGTATRPSEEFARP